MVDIVSRKDWGAKTPARPYTTIRTSDGIVAHHLGDGVRREPSKTDYAALMRQTQAFHMGPSRGWNDFAYGFGVGGGQVFLGRGWGVIDGADTDRGRMMHSVLWLGDSTANEIPKADMDLIWAMFDLHNSIYGKHFEGGHKDINPTGCPGDNITANLRSGRPVHIPTLPVPTSKNKDTCMYTIKNADNLPMTFRLDDSRLVSSWRYSGAPRTRWQEVIPGLIVENLGEPLVMGNVIWVPVCAQTGFGDLPLTLVQMQPGGLFTAHNTDDLHDFLGSLK